MSLRLLATAATDVGNIRDNNQDDFLIVDGTLYVVADGMGGHVAGEVASKEAVDAMRDAYDTPGSTEDLRRAVRRANGAVWKRGSDEPSYRGMGTTVTAVAVVEGDRLAVANVGDSRTYLMRDGRLIQVTQDHSFVQEAVRSGQLTPSQAESHPRRSQLTRALGVGDDVDVDVDVIEPRTGDRLLLCSDGLWDEVGDDLITMVVGSRRDPEEAASELVRWAKEAGGRDNITVIVVDVIDGAELQRGASASSALEKDGEATTAASRPGPATTDPDEVQRRTGRASRPAEGLMQGSPAASPRSSLVTWRVVAFVVVLVGVLATAAVVVLRGGSAWAVALEGNTVVVKEGDQIRERKDLQKDQLPPDIQQELVRGKRVDDRAAADAYINGITLRALEARRLTPPGGGVIATTTSTAGPSPTVTLPSPGGVPSGP